VAVLVNLAGVILDRRKDLAIIGLVLSAILTVLFGPSLLRLFGLFGG